MKHAWLLALLLLLPAAAAQTYTLYGQGYVDIPEGTLKFTFTGRSDAGLEEAVDIYQAVKKSGTEDQVTQALNVTREALTDAKSDDALIVETPWKSLIVPYRDCKHIDRYTVCFDSSVYYEEDVEPLGDGRLDAVRYENGSTLIPFTVTVEESTVTLSTQRTLNTTQAYPYESVKVTTLVTNTGRETAEGVTVTEDVPFPLKSGASEDYAGSLEPDDTLQLQYIVEPTTPGTYTFHGTVTSAAGSVGIADSILEVRAPLLVALSVPDGYTGRLLPVEVTLTNDYSGPVEVRSFSLSGSEPESFTSFNNTSKRASDKVAAFILAKGSSVVLTYTVLGDKAGEQSLAASASFITAGKTQALLAEAAYARKTPALLATAEAEGGLVRVRLTNDGLPTVTSVQVLFPDGYVKNVASFKTGAEALVEYTAPSGAVPDAVTVSYAHPITGKATTARVVVSGGGGVSSPPPVEQPPVEQTPPAETPSVETPPSQEGEPQAPATEVAPTSGTDGGRGFFSRLTSGFVNFLESVFG